MRSTHGPPKEVWCGRRLGERRDGGEQGIIRGNAIVMAVKVEICGKRGADTQGEGL